MNIKVQGSLHHTVTNDQLNLVVPHEYTTFVVCDMKDLKFHGHFYIVFVM